jgi:ppGpp synthetase/RelA/SpoT-type nucleotidyltranferase
MPMPNIFKQLEEVKDIVHLNGDKLYSFFNVQEAIDEIHVRYHHVLTELLGKSNDTNDRDKLNTEFNFNAYDFILFSFKSYKGQIPSNVEQENPSFPRRRFNLYRKGRIWSNASFNYGRNFYSFLDVLNEVFNETPINLVSHAVFKKWAKKPGAFQVTITQDRTKRNSPQFLYFPSKEELETLDNYEVNEVLRIFEAALDDDFLKGAFRIDQAEEFKKDLLKLKPRLSLDRIALFDEVIDSFLNVFPKTTNTQLDRSDGNVQTLRENIRFAALLYCYNHLPFDLHLFYPPPNKVKEDDLYTLMVALDPTKVLDPTDVQLFQGIVEKSPNLPEYEHDLIIKARLDTERLLRWKYIYEQNEAKYSTFMSAVENVCSSLCSQIGMKKSVVSARLKTFESFYTKLLERANTEGEHQIRYRDALEDPDKYKDFVFQDIRDIAGVRIICVFNDEVDNLEELFQNGLDDSDLLRSHIKKYSQNRRAASDPEFNPDEYNYRGFHVTVQPGVARRNLVEYKSMENVQCEIQIRTYFAHGWSDVEHPMVYKDKLYLDVIDDKFKTRIESQLGQISRSLKQYDEQIAKLKKERDEYKFPIIE